MSESLSLEAAMGLAIEQADAVKGATYPNPPCGAVLLDAAGRVAGAGATEPAGGAHAEVRALRRAGELAAGGPAELGRAAWRDRARPPVGGGALREQQLGARVGRLQREAAAHQH